MASLDNIFASKEALYAAIWSRANNPKRFSAVNNMTVTKLADDYAEGELITDESSFNPFGIVHGGCLATLADTVAGAAVSTRGRPSVTLNYNMNFISPATGTKIKCVATPQKVGKSICIYDCVLTNGNGQKVATATFTFFFVMMDLPDEPYISGAEKSPEP